MSSNDPTIERLGDVWRHQPAPTISLTPGQLAAQHAKLRTSVRRSLIVEYAGCALVVGWVAFRWWYEPGSWLTKANYVAIIAAVLVIARGLHRHFAGYGAPPSGADLMSFQRRSLERLRRTYLTAWRWYVLPFAPLLMTVGLDRWFFRHHPGRSIETDHVHILVGLALSVAIAVGVIAWHRVVAARLQRAIDYLDEFRGGEA